ncbi:phosphoribosyltransferase-like protein [Lentinula detonsa]|uniref:ribose-phosphate diphosphokinase n=1 Tax=Lentinula detonsa TaxID=2804962 RepID=A0AA38PPB5_9AGAR|nr:phosphoribosyltransferase-like protein [Lentinula detonsa]
MAIFARRLLICLVQSRVLLLVNLTGHYTGNCHPKPAQAVTNWLNVPLVPCTIKKFSNGEINVEISESVQDEDVFIINPLLILISASKTASARRITAVIPSFPCARIDKSQAPITAKHAANMLVVAGCDHIITMDLHASQIRAFFDIPVNNLFSEPLMLSYNKCPDVGGAKW